MLLDTGDHFKVKRIVNEENKFFMLGNKMKTIGNSFTYPCESSAIGIWKLGTEIGKEKKVNLSRIQSKCMVFDVQESTHVMPLLHSA